MSSFLGREDEEREKARDASLEVPYDLKAIAYVLDERYKQSVVISLVGKAGRAEQIVRSNTIRGEVAYNLDQSEMIENEGIKPADDWCLYCEEENYYWCEYRLYGQKQSCPEYELSKKRSKEEVTSPLGTAQQVAAGEKPTGRVDVQVKTGTGWKPIPVKDEEKAKTTPIPVKPLTGVQSYKGHAPTSSVPVKTGFQAPAKPSSLPFGLLYKCPHCWHWLESEEKLAIHFKWSCPGRDDATGFTIIPCKCCGGDFEKMIVSKKPPAEEGTNEKEADTK